MKKLIAGAAILALACCAAAQTSQPTEAQVLVNKGFDLLYHKQEAASTKEKSYAVQAIECFEKAISIDPSFAAAYSYLPLAYWLRFYWGEIEESQAEEKGRWAAQKAMELAPNSSMSYVAAAFNPKQYDEDYVKAEKMLKKAISLDPGNTEAHRELAWLYTSLSQFEEALEEAKLACETDKKSVEAISVLGRSYLLLNQFDDAVSANMKALELQPTITEPYFESVYAYMMGRHFDKAEQLSRKALAKYPENNDLKNNLAWILASKGDKEEARVLFEETQWNIGLGWIAALLGESEKTLAVINEISNGADKDKWWMIWNISWLYLDLGDKENAICLLEQVLEKQQEQFPLNLVHWGWRLATDFAYDGLRNDPRFQTIIAKSGYKPVKK